jgi:hypothetical protein
MMGNKIKKNEDHIDDLDDDKIGVSVSVMVINVTFNNVSVMSWQSAFFYIIPLSNLFKGTVVAVVVW